jgi:hypothetical protein
MPSAHASYALCLFFGPIPRPYALCPFLGPVPKPYALCPTPMYNDGFLPIRRNGP